MVFIVILCGFLMIFGNFWPYYSRAMELLPSFAIKGSIASICKVFASEKPSLTASGPSLGVVG